MKHVKFGIFLSVLLVVSACGTAKKSVDTGTQSLIDGAYIEKFHEAVRLKIRGQNDEAIASFEECLTLKPTADAVCYALSELYLKKQNLAKSAQYIEQAAQLDPSNIWYTEEFAFMLFEQKKYPEALKVFEKLVKHEPRNVEWMYSYAECLVKVGKTSEAIKALEKTEELVGENPEIAVEKFKLYLQLKQADKGLEVLNNARKKFPNDPQLLGTLVEYYFKAGKDQKAIELLEDLAKASPENGRVQLVLADIYRQQGKKKLAFETLKRAFECDDVSLDSKMKILISLHDSSKKLDPEAYELMERVVAQYPTEAKAHSIRGDYMLRAEKNAEALKSYKKALEYNKNQYPIWNQVMMMEYQASEFESLYADSKACLELFPTIPTVFLLNGISAIQTKRYPEAIEILEAGKELVTKDKELEAEMYAQLGEAYFGNKNYSAGVENYEHALTLDPGSLLIKNNYAYRLALAKQQLNRALTLINENIAQNDQSSHYNDTKGFILFQQGNYPEALVWFQRALTISPNDKLIVEHIGDAYLQLNDKEKAIDYLKKAKELGSTNRNLDKKIEKKEYYEPTY